MYAEGGDEMKRIYAHTHVSQPQTGFESVGNTEAFQLTAHRL